MNSKAQIIATIGPATKDKEMIREMAKHNMDVVRLNFSWGTYEEHASYIKNVKEVAREIGKTIPIIQDLSGPRIQREQGHGFNTESFKIITPKDLNDLKFGIENGVDYIAMSFVGKKEDIDELRSEMVKLGKVLPIIAKIERKVALDNIDPIIDSADAIMVARGDLGNEVPIEEIPFIEKNIIEKCKAKNKPVIVATQMMLSMMKVPLPTRAEITDIAFAIVSGADAVMLSEESALGEYPLQAVEIMERGILEAEKHTNNNKINKL